MKAVYFLGDRKIEVRNVPDPTPGFGEVVIEVRASGMCGSDLKYYRDAGGAASIGFAMQSSDPVIAGHEPCGVVVELGQGVSSPLAKLGERVMNHHYAGCGCCRECRTGWTQMCDESTIFGVTANGAHAQYMVVPVDSLIALPEQLSFKAGAAISCGSGTAWGALERLALRGTETIAIFGQGPVGLSTTQLAAAMGARVIAIDINEQRLSRAAEFGADVCINSSKEDVVSAIYDVTGGRGADCSVESTGVESVRTQTVQSTGKWGRVLLLGEGGDMVIDVSSQMNRKQLTVMGSWTLSKVQQADCARFITSHKVDIDSLFTHSWPLDQAKEAYELFDTQTTGKGVLIP